MQLNKYSFEPGTNRQVSEISLDSLDQSMIQFSAWQKIN